jgi:hypothetical protein
MAWPRLGLPQAWASLKAWARLNGMTRPDTLNGMTYGISQVMLHCKCREHDWPWTEHRSAVDGAYLEQTMGSLATMGPSQQRHGHGGCSSPVASRVSPRGEA